MFHGVTLRYSFQQSIDCRKINIHGLDVAQQVNTHFEFSHHAFTQPESYAKIISRLGGSFRNFNIAAYQTLRYQLPDL